MCVDCATTKNVTIKTVPSPCVTKKESSEPETAAMDNTLWMNNTLWLWFGFVVVAVGWFVLVWAGLLWFGLFFLLLWYGLCWCVLVWVGLLCDGLCWFGLVWAGSPNSAVTKVFLLFSYYMTLQTTTQLQHLNNNSHISTSQQQLIHFNFKTQLNFNISTTTQQMQALQQNTEAHNTHIYTHNTCRGHIMHMI